MCDARHGRPDTDSDALRQAVETAGPLALAISFIAGLAFSFNPVALAAIPVSLAYVTRARKGEQALMLGTAFVVGMLAMHVLLGAVADFGGSWIELALGRWWGLLIGPVLIVLGLMWAGWLRIPLPANALRGQTPVRSGGCPAVRDSFLRRHLPCLHTGTPGADRRRAGGRLAQAPSPASRAA